MKQEKPRSALLPTIRIFIAHNQDGLVNIRSSNSGLALHYTTDGTLPDRQSPLFTTPFPLPAGGIVNAIGFVDDAQTPPATATFGVDRRQWKILRVSLDSPFDNRGEAGVEKVLDDNPDTYWHTYHQDKSKSAPPHVVDMDMGRVHQVRALTMMPHLEGNFGNSFEGIPDQYEFHLSLDDKQWQRVAAGEFSNIRANPAMQIVNLPTPVPARYLRFVAKHAADDVDYVVVSGIGVVE